jgi:LPXTG-motif cell wall-anchored protein
MYTRLLVGIVCLANLLPCQNEGAERADPGERDPEMRAKMQNREREAKGEDEMLTDEQRLERNIVTGASAMCRFQASVTPPRLLPGQSGVLRVVASLQGDAVIPSPATLDVLPNPQQGPVSLGAHSIRPAEIGQLAKGYLGRPVYDNYVVLEMPVTMGPEAELGRKYQVKVDMKFDLYSGTSTSVFGRFLDHATTEIEVGATPVPIGGAASTAASPTPAANEVTAPAPAATGRGAGDPLPATGPVSGHVFVPDQATSDGAVVPPAPAAGLPQTSEEDGLPPFLLVGGGVLLLVVILMLVRRK